MRFAVSVCGFFEAADMASRGLAEEKGFGRKVRRCWSDTHERVEVRRRGRRVCGSAMMEAQQVVNDRE